MDNTKYISPVTEILKSIRAMMHAVAPQIEPCDISLLEDISICASYLAQDLRRDQDVLLAQLDEHEALMADRLMVESDALDHHMA